jgi:hypothetical protein
MKRLFVTVLAIVLCSLCMQSCIMMSDMATEMYWNLDDPAPVNPDEALDTLCIIKYTYGDKINQTVIHNQSDLDILLYRVLSDAKKKTCTLIRSGNTEGMAFSQAFNEHNEQMETKFSSADINKVKEWAKKMLLKGYQVEVVYDKRNKLYVCTARIPKKK